MYEVMAIMDLQYGSTGKGQIAGTIAHRWEPDTVATAWGPNAGHTFRNGDQTWVNRMLATSILAPSVRTVLIGPGTVLDVNRLAEEIKAAAPLLKGKHLIIHPQAAYLRAEHAQREAVLARIGSTMKGTAEAAMDKMRRDPDAGSVIGQMRIATYDRLVDAVSSAEMSIAVSSTHYDQAVDRSTKMIVEGAQGFSLGIHTDFYPYTTSRDVSVAQMFADCRIPLPHSSNLKVVGVCRTYPIRVANRPQGTSGGCYPDQEEISWDLLGKLPELTTVTRLPRRVFTFSYQQVKEAVRLCNPRLLALTFCDYAVPEELENFVKKLERTTGVAVRILSHGPTMQDVETRPSLDLPAQEFRRW
jgi:adenylosuccinate synthase